jgi:hypothetical protein
MHQTSTTIPTLHIKLLGKWQRYQSRIQRQQCGHVGSFKVQVHGFCGIKHQHLLYAGMNVDI